MKFRNAAAKFGRKVAVAGAGLMVGVHSAFAVVDTAVSTAISDGAADGKTIAGAVLALIIGIAVFKHMRRGT